MAGAKRQTILAYIRWAVHLHGMDGRSSRDSTQGPRETTAERICIARTDPAQYTEEHQREQAVDGSGLGTGKDNGAGGYPRKSNQDSKGKGIRDASTPNIVCAVADGSRYKEPGEIQKRIVRADLLKQPTNTLYISRCSVNSLLCISVVLARQT